MSIKELVTLLDRAEELTEDLKALDRTKSELVQILSHELRTPVTVIQGTLMTLGKPGLNLTSKEKADISSSALKATAKLARLAGNVSAVAGLGREGAGLPTSVVPASELLSRVAAEFPHQTDSLALPAEGEAISTSLFANLDLAVRALVLVIENALELSPEGEALEVQLRRGTENLEIHVSDRGPGIPEELKDHIFELFAQADSSSTRTHQGLGIGLYLARRIMTALGGKLDLLPRPGRGSTFVFTFPTYSPVGRRHEFPEGG